MKRVAFILAFISIAFTSFSQNYYYGTNMGYRYDSNTFWLVYTTDSLINHMDTAEDGHEYPVLNDMDSLNYEKACIGDIVVCYYPQFDEWWYHQVIPGKNCFWYRVWTESGKTRKRLQFQIEKVTRVAGDKYAWETRMTYWCEDLGHGYKNCHHPHMKCWE